MSITVISAIGCVVVGVIVGAVLVRVFMAVFEFVDWLMS